MSASLSSSTGGRGVSTVPRRLRPVTMIWLSVAGGASAVSPAGAGSAGAGGVSCASADGGSVNARDAASAIRLVAGRVRNLVIPEQLEPAPQDASLLHRTSGTRREGY